MCGPSGAPNGLEALAVVMRHVWLVNDHFRPDALYALLEREVGPDAKETAMTVGQQLIEQGKVEGRLKGRLEGERALLLRLLRQRFGAELDDAAERRVAGSSLEQLETWSLWVLSAASLAALFAD